MTLFLKTVFKIVSMFAIVGLAIFTAAVVTGVEDKIATAVALLVKLS